MSMLTAQVDELRTASTWVSLYLAGATSAIPMNTAILLRDAADTIENLRDRLAEPWTCRMDFIDTFERYDGDEEYLCECSVCGGKSWEPAHDLPQYCRKCGAKVVI